MASTELLLVRETSGESGLAEVVSKERQKIEGRGMMVRLRDCAARRDGATARRCDYAITLYECVTARPRCTGARRRDCVTVLQRDGATARQCDCAITLYEGATARPRCTGARRHDCATVLQRDGATARLCYSATARRRDCATARRRDGATAQRYNHATGLHEGATCATWVRKYGVGAQLEDILH
ncbi:hypothetical protein BU17DRAFT_81539 [Hysterangium stoloniferum]|nr:hypothetical protein BU17DRAFT_81539 [Hysterangium stoloniferum]